jgi:hypothetical protein
MKIEVVHEPEKTRFVSVIDGLECYLNYRMRNEDKIDFYYTYVPSIMRGKGIAAQIVAYAFEFAKENNLIVIPTCPYIWSFLERNQNYSHLIS